MVDEAFLERWREEMQKRIEKLAPEKIPTVIKRCPKCQKLCLEFNPENYRVWCTHCGFEVKLKA